jgi:hypothetical protein
MVRNWIKKFFVGDGLDSERIYLMDEEFDRKYNLVDIIMNMSARIDELEEQVALLQIAIDNSTQTEYNLRNFTLGE